MFQTRQACSDPDAFPAFQLFILAIVRLAEPIALTSIFPYAWAQAKHFRTGGDDDDAAFYAGVLISAFSLAEALMGMYWGGVSDRVGRKPVLLLGCVGTMLSLLVVGLAQSLWVALLGRLVGGMLNGNIGVIQTMVGELVKKPEHEPRAYAIMPFVWSIGTIVGPAIGGTFADPHQSYPNLFPAGSLFDRFPYLLPNLICALLLLVSIVLGYVLLEETRPGLSSDAGAAAAVAGAGAGAGTGAAAECGAHDCGAPAAAPAYVSNETPLLETSDALKRPAVDLRAETYGTFTRGRAGSSAVAEGRSNDAANHHHSSHTAEKDAPANKNHTVFSRRIMAIILALSIFTYHSMAYDATLPIFLEDDRVATGPAPGPAPQTLGGIGGGIGGGGVSISAHNPLYAPGGLGLSLRAVGLGMAVNGGIALFVQAVVFPLAAARVGVWRLFVAVTVLHPLAYVLVPLLLWVPPASGMLYPALYACLTVRNLCAILVYPLLLILLKEATPSAAVLGRVNGLAASAGAACRMVAPPVAGYLYTVGRRIDCTALAWYSAALVAVVGAVQCFAVERPRERGQEREREAGDV